jgi:hypothetical protein
MGGKYMFRKLISFILLVISIVAILFYAVTLSELSSSLGMGVSFDDVGELFSNLDSGLAQLMLATMFHVLLEIFGIPLIMLGVSIIGLTTPSRSS